MAATGMSFLGVSDASGRRALGGVGAELFRRLERLGAAFPDRFDSQLASVTSADPLALQQMLLTMLLEASVQVLLHTFCVEPLLEHDRVRGVLLANKAGLETALATVLVDATGDADVAARAGAQFVVGRCPDRLMQPVTRIFRVGDVDVPALFAYLREHPEEMSLPDRWQGGADYAGDILSAPAVVMDAFPALVAEARAAGEWTVPRDRIGIETSPVPGTVTINASRVHHVDGTDPDALSRAEVETQRQTFEIIQFLRRRVPGFRNARLVGAAHGVGVRETRHVLGAYVLTLDDVLAGRSFPDTVARGAYPVDLHDLAPGTQVLGEAVAGGGVTLRRIERAYGIPLRCLIPTGVPGLLVAGRAISATHEAAGSVRGQAVCMATGHAAGTIAAFASRQALSPDQVDVGAAQDLLQTQGAILFYPDDEPARPAKAEERSERG